MRTFRIFVALRSWLVVACCIAAAPAVGRADVPAGAVAVRLTKEQGTVFSSVLAELARQAPGVAFVVEGTPRRPALPASEAPDLSQSAPLPRAVQTVAAAYGYAASRDGSVFRLKKTYEDPRDLPDVTLEECERAAQDLRRVLLPFRPTVLPDPRAPAGTPPLIAPTALRLFTSLTPEQKRRAARPDEGVALGALSPDQQKLARGIALYLYVQVALTDVDRFLEYFRRAKASAVLTLRPADTTGDAPPDEESRWGFEVPGPEGRMYFNAFSRGITVNPLPQTAGNDTPAPPNPADQASDSDDGSVTLAELAERLTRRGPATITVDDVLRGRHVLVIGGEAAPVSEVLKAVAFVQGLRVAPGENGALRLARATVRVPATLDLLPDALRLAVPEPLRRAGLPNPVPVSLLSVEEFNQKLEAARTEEEGKALLRERLEQRERARRNRENRAPRLLALRKEAGRRLWALSRPEREKPGSGGRVPVIALSGPGRNLFALALTAPLLNGLQPALRQQPPRYVTQFDQLYVSTESTKNPITGKFDLAVYLAQRDPRTGELRTVGGVGSLKDPDEPR